MNQYIALALCIIFIAFSLKVDRERKDEISIFSWIPSIYFILLASKPIAVWFYGSSFNDAEDSLSGSIIDRYTLLVLIVVGLIVLVKRKKDLLKIANANKFLVLFVLYCGLSILWSDYPEIAFRRYLRGIGTFVMILVILTEKKPCEAINLTIKRLGYILIPISVLVIKYFRNWGIIYGQWIGEAMVVGVASHKNKLGQLCALSGLYFLWKIICMRREKQIKNAKIKFLLYCTILMMVMWLLVKANSATSTFALMTSALIYMSLGSPLIKKNINSIGVYTILSIIAMFILLVPLNFLEFIVELLGRNLTLTERVFIWQDLLDISINEIVGCGFESFWLGERLEIMWEKWKWRPSQAHNGYLEIYLNLGLVGLILLSGVLLKIYGNIRNLLKSDFEFGRFQMAYFGSVLLLNITEASMRFISLNFAIILLIALYLPNSTDYKEIGKSSL